MLTYTEARLTLDLIEYRDWYWELTPERFWPEEEDYAYQEVRFWLVVPSTNEDGDTFNIPREAIDLPYDADESWLVHRAFAEVVREEERAARERFTWKSRKVFSGEVAVERLWDVAVR